MSEMQIIRKHMTGSLKDLSEVYGLDKSFISRLRNDGRGLSADTLLGWISDGNASQKLLAYDLLRERYPDLVVNKYTGVPNVGAMATRNNGGVCTCQPGSTLCPVCNGESR